MMSIEAKKNSVFIGNVPFDATEEKLKQIFDRVGPVIQIRLGTDKDTKQFKGYAFCEYRDVETAKAAVRNLNGTDYQGRPLRVDMAENADTTRNYTERTSKPAVENTRANSSIAAPNERTVPDPTVQPDIQTVQGEIAQLMQSMSTAQLYYILAHMQKLVVSSPEIARALLTENPQLCYALLHAQFLLGMVQEPMLPMSAEEVSRVKDKAQKIAQGAAAYLPPVPQPGVLLAPPLQVPPPNFQGLHSLLALGMPGMGLPGMNPLLQNRLPGNPSVPRPVAPVPGFPAEQTPEQVRLLTAKLNELSPEQLSQLPQHQQIQVLNFLRQQQGR